jgi:SAM-dependent methyltransferase
MKFKTILKKLIKTINYPLFQLLNRNKEKFECPICKYYGPFMDISRPTGVRKHAKCPNCSAVERHRIQFLVLNKVLKDKNTSKLKMLHLAPEPFFKDYFSNLFGQYNTGDLYMSGVDFKVDLQKLPFNDQSYDFVFASHVLEHIPDDLKAIAEIRRILKPNGIAILPVPIVTEKTIEYSEPNHFEDDHVRAPGYDYFKKYEKYFSKVEKIDSRELPEKFQIFVYEDRTKRPSKQNPLIPSMQGEKHIDIVPVCYV